MPVEAKTNPIPSNLFVFLSLSLGFVFLSDFVSLVVSGEELIQIVLLDAEKEQVLGTELIFKHGRDIEVAWVRKESKGVGWHGYVIVMLQLM